MPEFSKTKSTTAKARATESARARATKRYGLVKPEVGPTKNWGLRPNSDYLIVAPTLDLSGYRASGHFDTVKLRFELCESVQFNTLRKKLKDNRVVTPNPDKRKAHFSLGFGTSCFYLTLQNPTPEKLTALYSVVDEFGGFKNDPAVYEAHFALDWKHNSYDRVVYLATVLPHFVKPVGVDLTEAGTPRQFVPNGTIDPATGHEMGDTLHLRTSVKKPKPDEKRYAYRPVFYHYQAAFHGPLTTYFGPKLGDHIRTYLKDFDGGEDLHASEHVVRHERVFMADALLKIGVTSLASLLAFDARKLSTAFSYEVAALKVMPMMPNKISRLLKLASSGVFAVRESEGGIRYKRFRPTKVTLAHAPMNKRSNSAWAYFSDQWTGSRKDLPATKISKKVTLEAGSLIGEM